MSLEDLLREVLAEVATEAPAPAPDRADRALGRTRRRTGVLVAAAAAVLLVVAGAVLVPVLRDPAPTAGTPTPARTPTRPPAPTPAPVGRGVHEPAVTGPVQLTSWANADGSVVRLPGRSDWRRLRYPAAAVSPTGRVAVTASRDPGRRLGIIDDLDAGRVRWVPLSVDVRQPVWSRDGRRLLVTVMDEVPYGMGPARVGFLIVDPDTLATTATGLPADEDTQTALGQDLQTLRWDPSGESVVGSVSLGSVDALPRWGVRWWRPDGSVLRTLPTPGPMTAGLSPSGRYLAVSGAKNNSVVLDVGTRQLVGTLAGDSATAYGWRDDRWVVTRGGAGLVLVSTDPGAVRRPYADQVGPDLYQDPSLTPVG